jgi:endonuclease III
MSSSNSSPSASPSAKQKILARLGAPLRRELNLREPEARPVLDQILYAILREGVSRETADKAYEHLLNHHFDLNEIRVSTARETADSLRLLSNSFERAERIINVLQELFETTFGFDLENLAKKGLKLAEKQLERFRGTTPFVVAYLMQNALGGHAIPLDADMRRCLNRLKVTSPNATPEEARTMLEHQVPKARGPLFFEALSAITHQFCHEHHPRCSACPMLQACVTGQRLKARRPAKPAAKATPKSARSTARLKKAKAHK